MKVQLKVGNAILEADGKTPREVWKELSAAAEAFCEPCCGQCKSESIIPHVRVVDGNTHYEMVCLSCGAKLVMGQPKVGEGLYAKRKMMPTGLPEGKNEKGVFDKVHKGWHVYKPPQEQATTSVRR